MFFCLGFVAVSAKGQEKIITPSPDCINYSTLYQDIALVKTSRVDNKLFESLEGKTIHNIVFKSIDVFDQENPDESNSVFVLLNKLHINTRSYVVESQLLFHSGDTINAKSIHETERILRTRKYFSNAYILPESVCGNQVNLLVVTQDTWALEPQFAFSRKSGSNQTGFGVSDGNILGSGNSLTISYSDSKQRTGVGYDFSNPHFLNKEIDFRLYYEDTSDGQNRILDVSRPFYALDTPWATGMRFEDFSLIDTIRSRGDIINEYRHQAILNEVFFGKATNVTNDFAERWLIGFSEEKQNYYAITTTVQGTPLHNTAVYPWVEYQYLANKFGVYKNVNQIQRAEDIALGQNFSFRIGMGGTSLGNPDDVIRFKTDYTNVIDIKDIHIFEYEFKISGRKNLEISNLDSTVFSTHVSYNYFKDEKNRWYSLIAYDVGQDLSQDDELTVGDLTGLRGYPTDFVRGKQRYLFTLERRYFSDLHIFNLFRVGGALFFDMGKAWGLPNQTDAPMLADVGIGLRFSSTKIRVGNIIHIDVSKPTTNKSGISQFQLTIGAYQKF